MTLGLFISFSRNKNKTYPLEMISAKKSTLKQMFSNILPIEFTYESWYVMYWRRVLIQHKYVSFFSSEYKTVTKKSMRWIIFIGRIVNFIVLNTILCLLVIDDNNLCGSYTSEKTCTSQQNIDLKHSVCVWERLDETRYDFTCNYNDPPSNFYTTPLLFAFIIVIISAPLDWMLEILAAVCAIDTIRLNWRAKRLAGEGGSELLVAENKSDLKDIQPLPSKWMLAARLVRLQSMDTVVPKKELEGITSTANDISLYLHGKTIVVGKPNDNSKDVGTPNNEKASNMRSTELTLRDTLLSRINTSRNHSKAIAGDMKQILFPRAQETYLLKQFLLKSLSGFKLRLAQKYFFSSENSMDADDRMRYPKIFATIILVIYLIGCICYSIYYCINFGKGTVYIWLITLGFLVAEDVFVLQPISIFFNYTLMSLLVTKEIEKVHRQLCARVRSLLRRKRGVLVNTSELIQHLNPACRAAREYPHLMVSRLLISMSDYDFPLQLKNKKKHQNEGALSAMKKTILGAFGFLGKGFAYMISIFPPSWQNMIVHIIIGGALSYSVLMITTTGIINIIIFAVIVGILFILILVGLIALSSVSKTNSLTALAHLDAEILEEKPAVKILQKESPRSISIPANNPAAVAPVNFDEDKMILDQNVVSATDPPKEKKKSINSTMIVEQMAIKNENQMSTQNFDNELNNAVSGFKETPIEEKSEIANEILSDDDGYCRQFDIPIVHGPPIRYRPQREKSATQSIGGVEAASASDAPLETSKSNPQMTGPGASSPGKKIRLPWGTSKSIKNRSMRRNVSSAFELQNADFIGGRMPKLEGPGARARRQMREDHMRDMGRTADMDPNVKTSREIVSANPLDSEYTLDDVFQAFSREMDKDLVAISEVRKTTLGSTPRAGKRSAKGSRELTDRPMWL